MFWGGRQPKDSNDSPQPNADQPVTREKLPAKLQQIVDQDDFYEDLYSS